MKLILIMIFAGSIQIDEKERDAETVKSLYDLIDLYEVPTPPEDLAEYQVFQKPFRRFPLLNERKSVSCSVLSQFQATAY